ncbi:phosphoribosylformylglycinamidine cyclo-ligase [Spiroplasma litorale]|uniref:Phosphoribosylformylglycinamidine cyclo-ligase n=1 Tax=Spiroplasma litorale TaxID=216942 RepID=A0A0K1W320_9MOLU|nr:phosphoribosylformylglycinamidine cyclo-ligase [Spiroplasma litorale]AKX34576.1 phosphoribosylformylglycinamidine cyclo-ligase [Spiroplasma litorale]
MSESYKKSGVDLNKGYEVVDNIKKIVSEKFGGKYKNNIGNFGCAFDLSPYDFKKPVLVSGTDGVGTKLLLAIESDNHKTIGIDLVAMCVNDILTLGAKPLYFLDYIAVDKINVEIVTDIISGIVEGCLQSDCSLLGGETAEMRDMYIKGHYDLAGFITGAVDKDSIIDFNNVKKDDQIISIKSSGIHSNGYSLVRKIFFKDNNYDFKHKFEELDCDLITELLKPTKIYADIVNELITNKFYISGMANITGGGLIENIPRVIPTGLCAEIYQKNISTPKIFDIMQSIGNINQEEMYNVFNMGVGFVIITNKENSESILNFINGYKDYEASIIGQIIEHNDKKINIIYE